MVAYYWDESFGWDWNKLTHLLPEAQLDKLATVMLDREMEVEDIIGWKNEESGRFSVSSAYSIIIKSPDPNNPGDPIEAAKWRAIWKLKVPSRMKTFLWLARHERIMTNSMRTRRGIAVCDKCLFCEDKVGDIDHALRNFPLAELVWRKVQPVLYMETRQMPFRVLLDRAIANKGTSNTPQYDNILLTITLCWIWKWRNELLFSNLIQSLQSKVQWIQMQVKEVNAAFARSKTQLGTSNGGTWGLYNWEKPEEDVVKINFDEAINLATNTAGCGGVTRNAMGEWLGGFISKIGSCPPLQAETWALLRSIQLAKHLGCRKVIFEGDSAEVINGMLKGQVANCIVQNILRACHQEIRSLESWRMSLILRESNKAADHMAKSFIHFPRGMHVKTNHPDDLAFVLETDKIGYPSLPFLYNIR